jgi:hypothetical protein
MARPRQVPFRFAPTTRPGPLLLKNSITRKWTKKLCLRKVYVNYCPECLRTIQPAMDSENSTADL